MRVATWNVNSIRQRVERVRGWLERERPEILCLQETKCEDELFPAEAFAGLGYHLLVHGQRTYNGVAILSRVPASPAEAVTRGFPGDPPEAERRLLAATFEGLGGLRVVNVYVPNGQSIESEKFPYKLGWLERLHAYLAAVASPADPLVLLGDFNIAPDDRDVYDPELWRGKVHFHPKEHEALARLTGWGLFDLLRVHTAEAGLYSWWDYRMLGFPKNRGLRIDLILGTAAIRERCLSCRIDRNERKGQAPSDHAPVVAEIAGP